LKDIPATRELTDASIAPPKVAALRQEKKAMIYGALILAFLLGMCTAAFVQSLVNRS
jgi:hypothetical protein